jgi:hypothetical protein
MNIRATSASLLTGICLAFATCDVEGQGASTNNYQGLGPQGPFTLLTAPQGIGGALKYFNYGFLNLSTGTNATSATNAAGVYTNNVQAAFTNYYSPTNGQTVFVCADFDSVDFQIQGFFTNVSTAITNQWVKALFAFSRDGTNWETNPTNSFTFLLETNANASQTVGSFVAGFTLPTTGLYAVALTQLQNTNVGTALTNLLAATSAPVSGVAGGAEFTAKAARKHVNYNVP